MGEPGIRTLMRQMNRSSVINKILDRGRMGRAEIAQEIGLSRASITSIVGELLEERLLLESGEGKASSQGGRRPIMLELNPDALYAVTLLLGSERSTVAIGNGTSEVIYSQSFESEAQGDPDVLMDRLAQRIDEAIAHSGIDRAKVRGLAIGITALVDTNNTLVHFSANLPVWTNVNLGHHMQQKTGLRTLVENETRLIAWGENWFGAGRAFETSVCVNVTRGIGTGVILGNQMLYGSSHYAGQFGHMTVEQNGPLCGCGNRGCWETVASNAALARIVERLLETNDSLLTGQPLTVPVIIEAARKGDSVAASATVEIGNQLGVGIANIINTINPEVVILHGDIAAAGDLLFRAIKNTVAQRAFKGSVMNAQILPSELGEKAGIVGAVGMIVRREFQPPIVRPAEQLFLQ